MAEHGKLEVLQDCLYSTVMRCEMIVISDILSGLYDHGVEKQCFFRLDIPGVIRGECSRVHYTARGTVKYHASQTSLLKSTSHFSLPAERLASPIIFMPPSSGHRSCSRAEAMEAISLSREPAIHAELEDPFSFKPLLT